jgi:restriction system protein
VRVAPGARHGGIDGIINEDRPSLEVVHIRTKRRKNTVGRPEIRKFVGALHGQSTRKGVFITPDFSDGAPRYARGPPDDVTLVDGEALADLMVEHDLGVSIERSYEIKRLDSD